MLKGQILRTFDSKKAIVIETDTSDHIMAEMLSQDRQLLELIFRKMNLTEQNYTISEKEIMTVVQTVKKWRKYLEGNLTENKVITDHKNLIYFREA